MTVYSKINKKSIPAVWRNAKPGMKSPQQKHSPTNLLITRRGMPHLVSRGSSSSSPPDIVVESRAEVTADSGWRVKEDHFRKSRQLNTQPQSKHERKQLTAFAYSDYSALAPAATICTNGAKIRKAAQVGPALRVEITQIRRCSRNVTVADKMYLLTRFTVENNSVD